MSFRHTVVAAVICLFCAGCESSLPEPVDARITDPLDGGGFRDIVEVVVSGDGEALTFHVTVGESPVTDRMILEMAIATVFIDVDDDPQTGDAGYGWDEGGFEYTGMIWVCKEGGEYCPVEGEARQGIGLATISLSHLEDRSRGVEHYPADPVAGERFVARVPYAALGVEPGRTIRVWVVESVSATREPEDRTGEARVTLG